MRPGKVTQPSGLKRIPSGNGVKHIADLVKTIVYDLVFEPALNRAGKWSVIGECTKIFYEKSRDFTSIWTNFYESYIEQL